MTEFVVVHFHPLGIVILKVGLAAHELVDSCKAPVLQDRSYNIGSPPFEQTLGR